MRDNESAAYKNGARIKPGFIVIKIVKYIRRRRDAGPAGGV